MIHAKKNNNTPPKKYNKIKKKPALGTVEGQAGIH